MSFLVQPNASPQSRLPQTTARSRLRLRSDIAGQSPGNKTKASRMYDDSNPYEARTTMTTLKQHGNRPDERKVMSRSVGVDTGFLSGSVPEETPSKTKGYAPYLGLPQSTVLLSLQATEQASGRKIDHHRHITVITGSENKYREGDKGNNSQPITIRPNL
jgi:hypothetical protein